MFGVRLLLSAVIASICLGSGWGVGAAWGAEPDDATAQPVAVPEQSASDLIRQLDADEFAQREDASRRLAELGAAALPELAKAAQGSSLEASTRAFAVLKKFIGDENPALQGAAREALNSIAAQREAAEKSKDDVLASAAAKAKEILGDAQPKYSGQPSLAAPAPGIPFPIDGPRPRIVLPGRHVVGNRISVRVVDGTREVDVEENQDDGQKRNVKIVSDPKSGIRMEVTTTKDGKSVAEKYAAKDEESLKKDHPEAFKIYQRYNGAGGAMQIGGGRIHIQGGRVEIGGGLRVLPERPIVLPGLDLDAEHAEMERQIRQLIEANPEGRAAIEALEQRLLEERRLRDEQRQRLREESRKAYNERKKRLLEERLRDRSGPDAAKPAPPAPPPAPAPKPAQVEEDLFGQ